MNVFLEQGWSVFLILGMAFMTLEARFVQAAGIKTADMPTSMSAASPVAGKRICLDPGHGAGSSGAVGPTGLIEKDVNLREALLLKEMLEKAGATVFMTRTEDVDPPLLERAKFNKANKTDLFVSLHHNANAQNDSSMNRTETFYHWYDLEGPSEDAARAIHREMEALLKLPNSKVYMCWAYGVLRENSYPAVLVEPSYLSNPEEEKRLRDENYLRSIAGAYFRGIEKFFEGGRPEIKLDEAIKFADDGVIQAQVVCPAGSALVARGDIRIKVDGQPHYDYQFDTEGGALSIYLPIDLALGKHEISIAARNVAGNTSFVHRRFFELQKPIVRAEAKQIPLFGGVLKDKVIVLDAQGGGGEPICVAPGGLRASDVNLKTTLCLFDYLKQCGASVSMTRTSDKEMDNVERVAFGLIQDPDVFLTIGHRMPEPGMGEKPGTFATRFGARWDGGTAIGKAMAYQTRKMLGTGAELGNINSRQPLPTEVHNWSSWEAMHAAQRYTALYVCPMMFDAPGVEERLSQTAGCRKEALALLYGLLANFGLEDDKMSTISGVVNAPSGAPAPNALVQLKDGIVIQTEADGRFEFKFLQAGKYEISVFLAGFKPAKQEVEVGDSGETAIKIELKP